MPTTESVTEDPRISVGSRIREAIESMPADFSAGDVADAVLSQLDPSEYVASLRELLVRVVASEASTLRTRNTPHQRSFSTKRSLIRDEYWPAFLGQRVALPSGYKRLAEATADDLLFLAQVRRTQANELLVRADQFERLADMMTRARVKFLEQLDAKAGEDALAA